MTLRNAHTPPPGIGVSPSPLLARLTQPVRTEYGPRLNEPQARAFSGLTPQQLKTLRRSRAIRFYRVGHRSIVYDRDSLAAWLAVRVVEPLGV